MKLGKLAGKLVRKEKKSGGKSGSQSSTLSFDLLYQLSYMSVVAAAGVPRALIFEHSAQLPCATAEYFRRIELNCRKLKYDYAKACQLVGESAKEEEIKALLLRFSSSLSSGEPEADFLAREAEAQAEAYDNEYGRKLETLKMWTDAYVSLILSAVLVIIMGIVSTMVWKVETAFIVGLAVAAIGTTLLGVWLIYLMAPREITVLHQAGSREQKLVRKLFKLLAPLALVVCGLFALRGANLGWALMMAAALIFPVGFISSVDNKKVIKRDAEVGVFLRSLGGVCAAIGTTVRDAVGRIDLQSINTLRREVRNLHTRLASGIRAKLCWQRFVEETGSELANRSVGMFCDAVEMGGEPERAGYRASLFASKIAMLRARRKTVSSPFRWLCIAMHGAVTMLLVFITEVIGIFGALVAKAEQSMPTVSGSGSLGSLTSFNFSGMELMHSLVVPLVLIFTVANAVAPSIADGGSNYKILHNLAITAAISGASLVFLPTLANMLFKSVQM
jgi:flagellar protein FlaJ